MIKVLVVDDSFFARKIVQRMLSADKEIEIIGEASNGKEGIDKICQLNPDVVCLDIIMPGADGITVLSEIMQKHPTPVVIFSSLSESNAEISRDAFKLGVVDVVKKPPSPEHFASVQEELIQKIKIASQVDRNKLGLIYGSTIRTEAVETVTSLTDKIISIGCPINRPMQLEEILSSLPKDLNAGLVVYQNMPKELLDLWIGHLEGIINLQVKLAEDGDIIIPGRVLVCPADKVIEVNRLQYGGVIQLIEYSRRIKPSIDTMFESSAKSYGKNVVAVVLSGIGVDGVDGLKAIKQNGGKTIVLYDKDIPERIISEKLADYLLPLDKISEIIIKEIKS